MIFLRIFSPSLDVFRSYNESHELIVVFLQGIVLKILLKWDINISHGLTPIDVEVTNLGYPHSQTLNETLRVESRF